MSASEIKSKVESLISTIPYTTDDEGLLTATDKTQQEMLDGLTTVKDFIETCIAAGDKKDDLQYLIDEASRACENLVGVCECLSSGTITVEDLGDVEKTISEIECGLLAAVQRVAKKEGA